MTLHDHLDATLPADVRADLLSRQMTTLEKCYQLTAVLPWWLVTADGSDADVLDDMIAKAPGHVCNFSVDDPAQMAHLVGRMQHAAVTRTRLGVPLLVHGEALNGYMSGGHMVFPTAIGLAATFSDDLVREMGDVIRRQMRRVGLRQALSPNMDIALDPRWGRTHETYGEDPYLCAAFSVAYTRGLQGHDLTDGVIATGKHFVGYGLPQGGINLSATEIGPRALRDLFAYPFEAAIQLAGLRSVMNSYADIDGVPAAASREVLTDLLRGTLGFDGFVTSDYSTLNHFVDRQRSARDAAEAGRQALAAGLDTENPMPYGYGHVLAAEVDRGAVDPRHLETAVRRVLTAKFELGLFENPYPTERIDVQAVAAEGADLSRELAHRSVVLLKNDGLLPLTPGLPKLAVVGPHADAVVEQFPTYTYPAFRQMTLFMSAGGLGNAVGVDPGMAAWNDSTLAPISTESLVRERLGALPLGEALAADAAEVAVEPGCTLTRDLPAEDWERAVAAARDADVVVLALGGASLWFNGERTEGEASDSADIALPAAQARLAEAVAATGTPVVVVLVQGRAYTLPDAVQQANAIVMSSYGGPFGPQGVADVLFGRTNPSGRLPYSLPRHGGQLPVYHHQKAGSGYRNSLPPSVDNHYLDMPATPLHPFGYGLSYTTFDLTGLAIDEQIDMDGAAAVSATVTNTGDRAGATVVQLYLRVNTTGGTRPAQQLGGFARVELAAGQSRRLTFTVAATQLGYTNLARDFAVEPAGVDVFVGFDAADRRLTGSFEVVGTTRVLKSSDRSFLSEVEIIDA
ncbi:beta-glucosidase [Actinoplanes sp. OR16]|uniref:glycoside hydrolase family 3 N-terminal domain-containing protein n=1 Tax=Actinoplanes sp. OR16 TaxID=946334 RepID=UPI000F71E2DD|nr:glycoside hydrolase family 3 N-terminal domain-containing protein [Actinoplanes sp. OR16]BBH63319.1 beta-glucosidase [Actinoplanes sp. OR16]